MSLSDGLKQRWTAIKRLKWLRDNAAAYFILLGRRPRATLDRPSILHLGAGIVATVLLITLTMVLIDASSIRFTRGLPELVVVSFDWITGLGVVHWFLVPIAIALATIAVLASPALPKVSRCVLAAIAVRMGFLFSAIALPGLVFTIAKRLIGRARPLIAGSADPFLYLPLGWSAKYASFPSGHATDAFAIATAIGALWPRTRTFMWTYAVMIAASRVVVTKHFPSDVLAGAIVGVVGVLLVRAWFASRRLVFAAGVDGHLRPMPGPSFARTKKVSRQLISSASSSFLRCCA